MPHTQRPVTAYKCPKLVARNKKIEELLNAAIGHDVWEGGFLAADIIDAEEEGSPLGVLVTQAHCKQCGELVELRIPWRGYGLRCRLDGESTSVTVEY